MVKVTLDNVVLAESSDTVIVEGNHYFPPDSVKRGLFKPSNTETGCPWKGTAHYYNAEVDGKTVSDIAWFYPEAKEAAKNIEGYIAFYKNKGGIKIEE